MSNQKIRPLAPPVATEERKPKGKFKKSGHLVDEQLKYSYIKAEIETRDLSDVPTARLLDLLLTYDRQAKEELIEPVFSSSEEILEEQADRDLLEDLTATQPRKLKVA